MAKRNEGRWRGGGGVWRVCNLLFRIAGIIALAVVAGGMAMGMDPVRAATAALAVLVVGPMAAAAYLLPLLVVPYRGSVYVAPVLIVNVAAGGTGRGG